MEAVFCLFCVLYSSVLSGPLKLALTFALLYCLVLSQAGVGLTAGMIVAFTQFCYSLSCNIKAYLPGWSWVVLMRLRAPLLPHPDGLQWPESGEQAKQEGKKIKRTPD